MNVTSILAETIRWPEMESEMLFALGPNAEAEFEALIERVEGRFRATPRYQQVLRGRGDPARGRGELTRHSRGTGTRS